MGQLRYICIHILTQCRSTSHCKDVQSHFLDVNVYKWMLSSTPIEVEVAQIFSSETKIVNKHFSERAHFIWFVMIKMPFLLLNNLNDINCGHVRNCVTPSIIF